MLCGISFCIGVVTSVDVFCCESSVNHDNMNSSLQFWPSVSYNFYGVANEMFGAETFWLVLIVVVTASVMLEQTIQMVS